MKRFHPDLPVCQRIAEFINIGTGPAENQAIHIRLHINETDQRFHFIIPLHFIAETVDLIQTCRFCVHANDFAIFHKALGNAHDLRGHGGREHQLSAILRHKGEDGFDIFHKAHIQHFVRLIQNGKEDLIQIQRAAIDHVLHAAGRTDNNIHAPFQRPQLHFNGCAAIDSSNKKFPFSGKTFDLRGNLHAKFAGRRQDQRLRRLGAGADALNNGDPESCRFAGSGPCLTEHIALTGHQKRDRGCLNGGRDRNIFCGERIQCGLGKSEIGKFLHGQSPCSSL